ncbi:MAG: hypothetical protein RID91_02450 [Azospirillaceae bacterium]
MAVAIALLGTGTAARAQEQAGSPACPPDPAFEDAFFIAEARAAGDNAFHRFAMIKAIGHGAGRGGGEATADFLARQAVEAEQPPLRYTALWAMRKRFPDRAVDAALVRAALAEDPDGELYTVAAAAAFLASLDEPGLADRFLPRLYDARRDLLGDRRQVFAQAVVAWALFEIGGPVASREGAKIVHGFADPLFPEDAVLLDGADGLALIGPAARDAAAPLIAVAAGRRGLDSLLHADDAARALAAVFRETRPPAFERWIGGIRDDLAGGRSVDAALDAAVEALPYSRCLHPEIAALAADGGLSAEGRREAKRFLRPVDRE